MNFFSRSACLEKENNNLVKIINNITDQDFSSLDSCQKYKIDITGECVEECPSSNVYYDFAYSYLNFASYSNSKIMIEHYQKNENTIQTPKYLFNKVCYTT